MLFVMVAPSVANSNNYMAVNVHSSLIYNSNEKILAYVTSTTGGGNNPTDRTLEWVYGNLGPAAWRTATQTYGYPFCTANLTRIATNTAEVATTFTLPTANFATSTLIGVRATGVISSGAFSASDTDWITLYSSSGTPLLQTGVPPFHAMNRNSSNLVTMDYLFNRSYFCVPGTKYRLGFCSSSTASRVIQGIDVPADQDLSALPLGTNMFGAHRALSPAVTGSAGPTAASGTWIEDNVAGGSATSQRWLLEPLFQAI